MEEKMSKLKILDGMPNDFGTGDGLVKPPIKKVEEKNNVKPVPAEKPKTKVPRPPWPPEAA